MTPNPTISSHPPAPNGDLPQVDLRGHSYDEHRIVLPYLLDTMASCGCWVLDQKALSPSHTELSFEVQIRSVFELYSGLIAAGIELSRDSHIRMTGLCTLRGHNPHNAKRRRIVTIRLELSFLEESASTTSGLTAGLA
jgi:hypothetical protein